MKHLDELGIEKLSTASPIPLSDPTPGAQPLSSNVVNITQAAAVGPWFRFQPNSNSEMWVPANHIYCLFLTHTESLETYLVVTSAKMCLTKSHEKR